MTDEITIKDDWLIDANGNRASVIFFGSEEAARKALLSLKNCKNCTNCSDCSGCSDCSDCSRCSDCSGCSFCSRCSDCSGCLDCLLCSRCSDCSFCSDCSRCSRCSFCPGCSDCSGCSRCSRCSDCSDCSDCSRKKDTTGDYAPSEVPVIEKIHTRIFEAASAEGALDMGNIHTRQTTHCRAGWVVHLAGDAGYALERRYDWNLAAMMIYEASGYKISPVEFYKSKDAAMTDMKRLAELEAAQ